MTPLIRSTMRYMVEAGVDPVELHWFDISNATSDLNEARQDTLLICRPPFEKCITVWQGQSSAGQHMETIIMTVGTDPAEGVVVSMWNCLPGSAPVKFPLMVYAVDDGVVRFGSVDEEETVNEKEGRVMMKMVAAWYWSMSKKSTAFKLQSKPTFTNRRKIAAGKSPTYDWHTVTIEPAEAKRPHQGGTHASPRLHDRRGHLRRLRSGKNVWVSPCKVGDPTKGVVFKDYQIGRAA